MTSQPMAPMTRLSTHLSMPVFWTEVPAPLLVWPTPLAIRSPALRPVVVVAVVVAVVADTELELVTLALLLLGRLGIVLVFPLITRAVPDWSNEYVVPSISTVEPGTSVVPSPSTYSVVPSLTDCLYV